MEELKRSVVQFIVQYGFQILGGVCILWAGVIVSKHACRLLAGWLAKRNLEPPVRSLIANIVRVMIIAFTLVIALGQVGVPIAPLVAGISVLGVGAGLAMQGVLANAVAGILIILTKPFRVGEYIDLLGVHGLVTNIHLFSTTLQHIDQSCVVIPNRKIVGEVLHNYGVIRQLDLGVGVAYDTRIPGLLAALREELLKHPKVLKHPAPIAGISALADSSINLFVRPWVGVADFATAQAEIYEVILERLRRDNIQIPFPQREIRLLK